MNTNDRTCVTLLRASSLPRLRTRLQDALRRDDRIYLQVEVDLPKRAVLLIFNTTRPSGYKLGEDEQR